MSSDERYPSGEESWLLYIVECRDGSLYTGITNDLDRRLKQHNDGDASRYTRSRRPVVLRYQEPCADRSTALIRELAVKLLSRSEKETLIKTCNKNPRQPLIEGINRQDAKNAKF